jgi:hypothetical protein
LSSTQPHNRHALNQDLLLCRYVWTVDRSQLTEMLDLFVGLMRKLLRAQPPAADALDGLVLTDPKLLLGAPAHYHRHQSRLGSLCRECRCLCEHLYGQCFHKGMYILEAYITCHVLLLRVYCHDWANRSVGTRSRQIRACMYTQCHSQAAAI